MLDGSLAVSEFRHRVANDLALVAAVLARRKGQTHILSSGEILDEAIDAIASLSALYRQLHGRPCADDLVDVGRHLADLGTQMDAGYLSGLGITLFVKAPAALGPSRIARSLGFIVLELVTNAARHGGARRIGVELATEGERWSCSVADDGVGLPDAFRAPAHGGLGYVARLASSIDGRLTISGQLREGACIRVCFPAPASSLDRSPAS